MIPRWNPALPALLIFLVALAGCGSSGETKEESPPPKDELPAAIRENEAAFNPSDYGIEGWEEEQTPDRPAPVEDLPDSVGSVEPDTVPGFRVQVMITEEIDKANALRDSLFGALPGQWIYIVHHPPYYKVRIGNYADRFAAEATLKRLRKDGLPDAWVVPDRIVRNPPPVPLPSDSLETGTESPPRN